MARPTGPFPRSPPQRGRVRGTARGRERARGAWRADYSVTRLVEQRRSEARSYHTIRLQQERLGNRQPKRLRRVQVDDQFELSWLRDREIGRLGPLEDPVDVSERRSERRDTSRSVRHQAPPVYVLAGSVDGWPPGLGREVHDRWRENE